jgi:hypothetical protein
MSAARKKRSASRARRRPVAPRPTESAVYDGRRFCGTLVERGRVFKARDARGRALGEFAAVHEAMAAITAAARAPVKPSEPLNPSPARAATS